MVNNNNALLGLGPPGLEFHLDVLPGEQLI